MVAGTIYYARRMPTLDEIRRALAAHEPRTMSNGDASRAAVAMVLRCHDGAQEVLFIERARREGDPWSGHMAFPGGRVDPGDTNSRVAAERETWEEVGLSLDRAEHLGRLDDQAGHHAGRESGMVISAFVYHVEGDAPLVPNHEVEQAFWFPLTGLRDVERQVEHPFVYRERHFPGILVGVPDRHIVWGLTYRFLDVFLSIIGKPLPDKWMDLR